MLELELWRFITALFVAFGAGGCIVLLLWGLCGVSKKPRKVPTLLAFDDAGRLLSDSKSVHEAWAARFLKDLRDALIPLQRRDRRIYHLLERGVRCTERHYLQYQGFLRRDNSLREYEAWVRLFSSEELGDEVRIPGIGVSGKRRILEASSRKEDNR